jgi:hypothetical protein
MDIGCERGGDERRSRCENGRLSNISGNEAPEHRVFDTENCRQTRDWPGPQFMDNIPLLGPLFHIRAHI